MGLEEANEPKGARRDSSSKPMGSMWCRKMRMDHIKPKIMQVKQVRGYWKAYEPQR